MWRALGGGHGRGRGLLIQEPAGDDGPGAFIAPRQPLGMAEATECEIPFLKGYTVFCVDQIDGLPAPYYAKAAPVLDPVQRIAGAEAFFAATGATTRRRDPGGNVVDYKPKKRSPGGDRWFRWALGQGFRLPGNRLATEPPP